ncbi:methyl-accepting chemotaxis protein [Desertibacillus haloalkaliphilus]|uniref:methyl-accepting chemotaxis protein n=1 Tax=Desertibacillus haloalkaliphilus TaxID=1328930 RepID=UPI001C266A60|nr:methyl-accepting chemotaxis protein [Desertibacillus haloalkaliphilus]MBU8906287.1 methyl-accepting chemotaxis protein [Desertibacillus haloalkaliphilus]
MKQRIFKNRLFLKIFSVFIICMLMPMVINIVYTLYATSNALENEASRSLTHLAVEKNKQVDSVFHSQFDISHSIINDLYVTDFFNELAETNEVNQVQLSAIAKSLEERVATSDGLYENMFYSYDNQVLVDGVGQVSVGHVFDRQLEAYYYEQLENPGVSASEYMYSPITERPVIAVSNSLFNEEGELLSVFVMSVDINRLTEELVQGTSEQNVHTMIIDPEGLVIASGRSDQSLDLNFMSEEHGQEIQDFYLSMEQNSSGSGHFTLNGTKNIGSFVTNEKNGLKILTYMPVEQYMGKVEDLKFSIILVITFSVIVASVIVIFRILTIIKPIRLVTKAAQKIANGDLTTQQLKIRSNDEIGELADSFNTMLLKLKEIITQVRLSSEKVAASGEELSSTSHQSSLISKQVANAIQTVSVGAEDQSSKASESADRIREMASGVVQVADNAKMVANSSELANKKANDGSSKIFDFITESEMIHENIHNTATKVKSLEERSKKIGEIVEVISNISDQTNLLALNASIEAARAGEHGRGFAVVANEVRKLAEQSKQSSIQIHELVTSILIETENTVLSINDTVSQSSNGVAAIKSVQPIFSDIQLSINEVTKQILEVSEATNHMSSSIEGVVTSMNEIESTSISTTSQSQQVSASMEKQLTSSKEITNSAQSLAKLADELQDLVKTFKL